MWVPAHRLDLSRLHDERGRLCNICALVGCFSNPLLLFKSSRRRTYGSGTVEITDPPVRPKVDLSGG